MSELCFLSAVEVLSRFKARTLKPSDYLAALIEQIEAYNPWMNVYTETYFDAARKAALEADTTYESGAPRALEGLPVAIKDVHHVQGRLTTQGSWAMGQDPDLFNDPIIARLAKAGAIFHMSTTVPEFCLTGACWSARYGVTRNPHNPDFAPGGSSGGSAAALAAGMTPLATGTDIGGSIRIPASACGLVGFKPPHGRNPDGPPFNFDRYNHCGVLSRTVGDTALAQNIISGPHEHDHDSLRERIVIPEQFAPRALRIAVSMDLGYVPLDEDVRHNTHAALNALSAAGCHVEHVELNWDASLEQAALAWYSTMHFGRQALWLRAEYGDRMTPYALAAAKAAEEVTVEDIPHSWEVQHRLYQTLGPVLEAYDVLICPTNAVASVPAEHDPTDPDFEVDGQKVDPEFGWVLTHPFNMLSNCPVMSVPTGRDRNNIPTGMQIIGKSFDDLSVFEAALLYEAHAPSQFMPLAPLPPLER